MTRLLPVLAALAVCTVGPRAAAATPEDYSLDADAWNGVGYLLATAAEAKVALEPVDVLDLGRLRPGGVLVWLAPPPDLPVDALLSFVRDGGYLIMADDTGAADPLFEALGLERRPGPPSSHDTWYQSADGIPLLTPQREHFLFFNVEQVAANYPSALRGAGDVVLGFDDSDEALIVERRLGQGAVLAIADPSMFLNEMLRRFYGNKQLAANALRLYCDAPDCRARLLGPHTRVTGTYRSGVGRLGRLPMVIDEAVALLNGLLGAIDRRLARQPLNDLLAWTALLLLALVVASRLRARRTPPAAPPLGVQALVSSPVRQEAMGLVLGRGDADFAEPSRVLLDEAARLAELPAIAALSSEQAATSPPASDEAHRADETARNALLRIHREADSLLQSSPTLVSAERFLRLLADVGTVSRYVEQRAHANPRGPRRPADGR
ncbi:MAG: hypothetical protein H6746_10855 [Deltaproteobacteria bacterium]|nr:hypothetical protein [Deltaproteobacteria bacterium]